MTVTLQSSNIYKFDCELCWNQFDDMIEFIEHIIESLTATELIHETQDHVDCPFCGFELTHPESRILLNGLEFHLRDLHNIDLEFIEYLDHLISYPDGKYGDWMEGINENNRLKYVHLQPGTSDEILFVHKAENGKVKSTVARYIFAD